MAITYRLQKVKHNTTVLSGEGAKLFGGRWNAVDVPLIYTSLSTSLAVLETLVHVNWNAVGPHPPMNFVILEVPDECVYHFLVDDLPIGWDAVPDKQYAQQFLAPLARNDYPLSLQRAIGDQPYRAQHPDQPDSCGHR